MKVKSLMKRATAKWPILLLLLMMPVLVFAQQDDKDKKKNPPPPPPKKSESGNPPRQAPPQHDAPPPHQTPPPHDTPPPHNPPPPNQGGKPPEGKPPQNPPQNPPDMKLDPSRGQRPDRTPTQGGPPSNGNRPTGQPVQGVPPENGGKPSGGGQAGGGVQPAPQPNGGRPTGQPVRGGQPIVVQPNGGQPNGGQPGQGGQPSRGGQPNGGQPGQGGQPPRGNGGGQPNGGQPFAGQPGQRNREQNHAPVPPPQQVHLRTGSATVIRAGGNTHVTTIRTEHGVTINHTDYGRRVVTVRPGGVTVVSIGNTRGFVQRPAARVGFVQRTYVVRGRPYVRVYRSYNYRGISYVRYVPAFYFTPRFYIWAYNPWVRPVYFGWGWGRRAPWFYGGYFAPAPYYVSASLWLTDYIISENLRAAYEAQLDAEGQQYSAPPPDNTAADPDDYNNAEVSPALRQAIADEVQRQLNAEKNAANNPQQGGDNSAGNNSSGDQAPPALAADQRVFVVSAPLQVYDGDQPCSLTAGDVVSRVEDSPGNDGAVGVSVLSSKNADCRPGAQPRIQVTDLQDMSNDLRAQTDEGLKRLSQDQGKNGLPPAPDVTQTPNPNGQGTPDPDAVNQLNQQRQDADQTEKEVGGPGGNVMLMPGWLQQPRAPLAGGVPLLWRPSIRFTLARYF